MGRAEMRKAEKQQRHINNVLSNKAAEQYAKDCAKNNGMYNATRCMNNPRYMKLAVADTAQKVLELSKAEDAKELLNREFERGYTAAELDYTKKLAAEISFARKNLFASVAIAMRESKIGNKRIGDILARAQNIMLDELTTDDLLERCEKMTGISIEDDMLSY